MNTDENLKDELMAELESAHKKMHEMKAQVRELGQRYRNESERCQPADCVRDSEIRYRRLFEAAKDGILILDAESGAITDANPYIREILGYSPQDLIGKRLWEIGAFFDVVASKAAFEELKQKEYIRYENLPLQTKDGQLREVEFISNVYLVDLKKVIQCNIRNITERKRAEEAIHESEERYRRLFEAAQDGILLLDAESGAITDANPFLLTMLGYSLTDLKGKQLWEVSPTFDSASNKAAFKELQQKGYIRYDYLPLETKDGQKRQVGFVSNVYLVNGKKVIQCNIRDITRRKHAEAALRESEERYRRLFETAQDGILLLNAESGAITDANPFLIKMLGYAIEDLIGKRLWEVSAFKDWEASKSAFEELQQNGYIRYEDLPLETKDGQSRQVEFVSNVYIVNEKKVVQCNIRDITERKHQVEILRENEERYRRLFETAQDGILLLDAESGAITDVNPFLIDILDYTKEELIGKRFWEVSAFTDREASKSAFEELQKKGYIRYENLPLETKDGQIRDVEFVCNVYLVNGKKIIQCNIRDITQRKWLEEDRQKLMDTLQTAYARIKELDGLLPICSNCKKIRNDKGDWQVVEAYISEHTDATFTHGVCPECMKILYPNYVQGNHKKTTGTL
jgi:PAS domain S-box-containing protein